MKVEYTDAPAARPEPTTGDKMPCPYCGHLLSKNAERCDRCDWARGATQTAEGKASDLVAVMFSIIPGLGHIYKGHILVGLLWMIGAIPVGIFVLLAAFASAGWGLGLFFFYLAAVMLHAYGIHDRVVPPEGDEGEEY
jgi:TM2 domain-containing membrane protein YozV